MDTLTTELKGVYFLGYLLSSDFVKPYLDFNDKTPGYDGYLQLSDGKGISLKNNTGRIHVQIKSHERKPSEQFPDRKQILVEKKYLDYYLNNNGDGLIFFHIYLDKHGHADSNVVYYTTLSRAILISYQKECEQTTISIPFKRLPKKSEEIIKVIRNSAKIIYEQKRIALNKTEKMEAAMFKGFNVSSGFVDSPYDLIKSINSGHAIAYTHDGLLIEDFKNVQAGLIEQSISIKVKDTEYFTKCTIIPRENETELLFCNGLNIHLFENGKYTLNYNSVEDLRTEYNILSFVVALIENREFSIVDNSTGKLSRFTYTDIPNMESFEIWKAGLSLYSKIIKILDLLNITASIQVSELKEQDCIDATLLYEGLYEKKLIQLKNEEPAVLSIIKIGNIQLAFINIRNDDGLYSIHDIRSSMVKSRAVKASEDHSWIQTVPIENVFKDPHIWECSNFQFDSYCKQLDDIFVLEPGIIEFANTDLLHILQRYDETNKKQLLSYADKLSSWIIYHSEKEKSNIYLLNRLQTVKRIKALDENEKEQLQCIVEDSSNLEEKIAACALLERKEKLQKLLKQLSAEEVQKIREWPIGRFLPKI